MDEEKIEEAIPETEVEESVMSIDSLREAFATKMDEMREKYHDVYYEIATKRDVDVGVGFDMLLAVCRGGEEYLDGVEVGFDREQLNKDYAELSDLSMKIATLMGRI